MEFVIIITVTVAASVVANILTSPSAEASNI